MLETILSAQCARGAATADVQRSSIPAGLYELFLENVVLPCRIGVFDYERGAPQRVRIDLLLQVRQDGAQFSDDIGDVLSYDDLLSGLKRILMDEHTNLVEMLAEKIAACVWPTNRCSRPAFRWRSSTSMTGSRFRASGWSGRATRCRLRPCRRHIA
jgi:dihydroneopterin aldolase